MDAYDLTHIIQGCFTGTGAIVRLFLVPVNEPSRVWITQVVS